MLPNGPIWLHPPHFPAPGGAKAKILFKIDRFGSIWVIFRAQAARRKSVPKCSDLAPSRLLSEPRRSQSHGQALGPRLWEALGSPGASTCTFWPEPKLPRDRKYLKRVKTRRKRLNMHSRCSKTVQFGPEMSSISRQDGPYKNL